MPTQKAPQTCFTVSHVSALTDNMYTVLSDFSWIWAIS